MVEVDVNGLVEVRIFVDGLECCLNLCVIQLGVVGKNMFEVLPRGDVVVLKGGVA